MKTLRGRNAILTGASRGLGVRIAHKLADQGVNLALAARSETDLGRARDEVEAKGVEAVAVPTDVGDAEALQALVNKAEAELGPTDILINNAGIEAPAAFADYPANEIGDIVRINLVAPMLLTRYVLPGMLERGRGHIVNVVSLAGKCGFPYETPYATTKAALIMFTQSLRAELYGTPVGASAVCPGFVAEDGMYARVEAEGVKAPRSLGISKPHRVTDAVVRAITRDVPEIIVNPTPMRPLLALLQFFPGMSGRVHKLLGTTDLGRAMVAIRDRLRF